MIDKQNADTIALWLVAQLSQSADFRYPDQKNAKKNAEYVVTFAKHLSEQLQKQVLTPSTELLLGKR